MATTDKLLTISVAAYNVADFIEETLASLLVRDLDQIEVLVVDDGATDATASIADAFAEKHGPSFRVIRKENGGYGSTVTRSISEARGKYFRLLDGDDWYDKDGLSALLRILAHTDADLVVTPWIRQVPGSPEIRDILLEVPAGEYLFENLPSPKALAMHGATFRTAILRQANIDLPLHCFYTDILYVSSALRHVETVRVTHIPVYHYRLGIDGQTVSDESRLRNVGDMATVLERLASIHDSYPTENATGAVMTRDLIGREYDTFTKVLFKAAPSSQRWDAIARLRAILPAGSTLGDSARRYGSQSSVLDKATARTYPVIAAIYRSGRAAKDMLRGTVGQA